MSRGLALGVVVAVVSLGYVLYPLVGRRAAAHGRTKPRIVTDEEIEAAVRSYRERQHTGKVCSVCGPRPESDALFCSTCGRRLDRSENRP